MKNKKEIIGQLSSLDEYEKVAHVNELNIINEIHLNNFKILKSHLEKISELKSSLSNDVFNMSIYSKIERNTYISQLVQYLNNYLSSAFSVIDYSRKHSEKYYQGTSLYSRYQNKLESEFINNPFHRFIQGLRNFVIHYKIPSVSIVKEDKRKGEEFVSRYYVSLNLKHLVEINFDWKSLAKKFLQSRVSDNIELVRMIEDYFNLLTGFQEWYKIEQRKLYKMELERIEKLESEFILLMFNELMSFIYSGKGVSFRSVENKLLYCFPQQCQEEILSVSNNDERLHLMLSKLKRKIPIKTKDIIVLQILLNENKRKIKVVN